MAGNARHQGVAANIDASRSHVDIEDVLEHSLNRHCFWCWMVYMTRIIWAHACVWPMALAFMP